MPNHKIRAAIAASDVTNAQVGAAIQILEDGFSGRIKNGHGIYTDPSQRRRDLRAAAQILEHALSVMEATDWPRPSDYDQAEDDGPTSGAYIVCRLTAGPVIEPIGQCRNCPEADCPWNVSANRVRRLAADSEQERKAS